MNTRKNSSRKSTPITLEFQNLNGEKKRLFVSKIKNHSTRDVHGGSGSLFFVTVAARRGSGGLFFITVKTQCGNRSFQKKKIKKNREFTQHFHFKKHYTVKLDEFHRLEAIALF